jgi:hypothetical protein
MTREQMIDEAVRRVYRPGRYIPVKGGDFGRHGSREEFMASVIQPFVIEEFNAIVAEQAR